MNFVGNDGESKPIKSAWIFVYVWWGTTSDYLVYLFGRYVFYRVGINGDNLRGEKFCRKKSVDNLSLLSCREETVSENVCDLSVVKM